MCDDTATNTIRTAFYQWSGGFPPESEHHITVFIDYANPTGYSGDDVRDVLEAWMNDPDALAWRPQ